jgi:RTC4-like domain
VRTSFNNNQRLILVFSYGELGSMILHQTLYNIFPPSSFDAQSIVPLTPQEFIQRILVPEAALALIMEDMRQDRTQAAQTMRESAGYGVAMFPDTSEGPGVEAGEDIVLERARARRRELEDEELLETLRRPGGSEDERSSKYKGTKRPKKLGSATTTEVEEITVAQRKTKRKKASSRTDSESGLDGNVFCGNWVVSTRKSARTVPSNLKAKPSSPHLSPPQSSPIQAELDPRSSSPEQIRSHLSKTEPRALQSKPISSTNDPYNSPKRFFANIDVETDSLPTTLSSQKKPDGRSKTDPIDVDDAEISITTDTPASFAHQPPIPVPSQASRLSPSRIVWSLRGPSDVERQEAYFDPPSPEQRSRGRLVGREASVNRHLESNNETPSLPTEQNQRPGSSVG